MDWVTSPGGLSEKKKKLDHEDQIECGIGHLSELARERLTCRRSKMIMRGWFGWKLDHFLELEELAPSSTAESLVAPQFRSVAGQWHLENVLVASVVLCDGVAQREHRDPEAWKRKDGENQFILDHGFEFLEAREGDWATHRGGS